MSGEARGRHGQGERIHALRASAGSRHPGHYGIAFLTCPEMATAHRVLPFLARICAAIDQLFVVEVGPFGMQLAQDARNAWVATGNKNRPVDVEQYVALLAQHIDDGERRDEFIANALKCIHV